MFFPQTLLCENHFPIVIWTSMSKGDHQPGRGHAHTPELTAGAPAQANLAVSQKGKHQQTYSL